MLVIRVSKDRTSKLCHYDGWLLHNVKSSRIRECQKAGVCPCGAALVLIVDVLIAIQHLADSKCEKIDRDTSGAMNIAWRALAQLLRLSIGNWSRENVKADDLPDGKTGDAVSKSVAHRGRALWNVHRLWQSCVDKHKHNHD